MLEGTMRFLALVTTLLSLLSTAQASLEHDDLTTTTTITTTVTSTTTVTRALTRVAVKGDSTTSPVPHEMTTEGKKYILQGCFAQSEAGDIGAMLGQNYAAPQADNMSLSLCLRACASAVVAGSQRTYPFVGVASGDSCYCGTTFNAPAPKTSLADCTLPCVGNGIEACGGRGYMSVYKFASPNQMAQSIISSSSGDGLASSDPVAQTNIASSHGSGAAFTENDSSMDTSGSESPGVIAGITIGSVSGVVGLLALVFVAARRCGRRRQTDTAVTASESTSTSVTTSAATNTHDAASIRDATRISLRRLDGVVMDHPSPSPHFRDKNPERGAATTGADWISNRSSPLTPRTPRFVEMLEEAHPSTPSIVVHPPEIAPVHGLGERAWHRRRLSAPFPPVGVIDDQGATAEGGKRDDRRTLPSQSSDNIIAVDSGDMPAWHAGQDAVSVLPEDGRMSSSPSWRWTLSTASEGLEAELENENLQDKA